MITLEVNLICDGAALIRSMGPKHRDHDCDAIFGSMPYERPGVISKAEAEGAGKGWRVIWWRGANRHLCPICSALFKPTLPTPARAVAVRRTRS